MEMTLYFDYVPEHIQIKIFQHLLLLGNALHTVFKHQPKQKANECCHKQLLHIFSAKAYLLIKILVLKLN